MEIVQASQQAFERGEYKRAINLVNQAINRNPHDRAARHVKALSYIKLGEFTAGICELDWLVENYPQETEYLSDRAVAHHKNGDNERAMLDFEKALLLEPERAYHYACRAYLKDRIGDIEGAVADYRKAIQLDPEDEIAKNNLEITQQKLGYKASKLFKYKSQAHFSEEEQLAYEKEYKAKHGTIEVESKPIEASSKPSSKVLLQEMGKVFTSKAAFKDFLRFLSRGGKSTSTPVE